MRRISVANSFKVSSPTSGTPAETLSAAPETAALEARVGDRTAGKGVERARQRDRPALGGGAKPRRG